MTRATALGVRWSSIAIALFLLGCRAEPPRSHIVLVTFDTLRIDHVGTYLRGSGHMPHVDEFAANALVHEAAFTTIPTTSPAHTSLFTGLHPYEHGVSQNGMKVSAKVAASNSLPAKLRDSGYATGAFVTSRVFGPQLMGVAGFESVSFPTGAVRSGDDAVTAALGWLDDTDDRPVFLWVHIFDAHSPYGTQQEKKDQYPVDHSNYGWVERSRFADAETRSAASARYARGVSEADAAFGRLVAGLRERLGSEALIIATADHGEFLDELLDSHGFAYGHGSILDEAVLHIPLLIRGPDVEPGRTTTTASIRDLYTTVLEAAGVGDPDAEAEGRRDLRRPLSGTRFVSAELRSFEARDEERKGIGLTASQEIQRNAVAVTDGQTLIVLGEDGSARTPSSATDQRLVTAARLRLAVRQTASNPDKDSEIDDETRRALESLGYVQ